MFGVKKVGRPRGSGRTDAFINQISLKLSDEQMEILDRLSESWHMSRQQVIREMILAKKWSVLN